MIGIQAIVAQLGDVDNRAVCVWKVHLPVRSSTIRISSSVIPCNSYTNRAIWRRCNRACSSDVFPAGLAARRAAEESFLAGIGFHKPVDAFPCRRVGHEVDLAFFVL